MDYLVVGAGPAGLQLGWLLHHAGRDYLVIEAGPTPGTFYRTFPRHRRMISINKPHTGWDDPELNLRMDWNSLLSDDPSLRFTRYTDRYFPDADDYVRYLGDYAAKGELNVECDTGTSTAALDAHLAVEQGVDGVIVSNHGGRQLDSTPATIDQLPLIVEAVEQRVPVLLDGGVRRGTDVVKALALGATAVAVGRPAVWGLAAGGEAGVARVLALLRNELDNALRLCGCDSPRAISHDLIGRRA